MNKCTVCEKETTDLRLGVCFACAEAAEAEAAAKKPPAPPDQAAAASEAAAVLARRSHEAAAERADNGAPVRMVDLHDLRTELLGELGKGKRAETVPHAVPTPTHSPAQGRSSGALGAVLSVVVLLALAGLAVFAERRQ